MSECSVQFSWPAGVLPSGTVTSFYSATAVSRKTFSFVLKDEQRVPSLIEINRKLRGKSKKQEGGYTGP